MDTLDLCDDEAELQQSLLDLQERLHELDEETTRRMQLMIEAFVHGSRDASLEYLERYSDEWRDRRKYPDEDEE